MNLYFWFFALYAVLITPIRLQADFLLGRGVRYRLRVQLAGVTLVRDRMHNSHALTLHSDGANLPLWLGILRQGAIRPVLRALRMQAFDVSIRFSFADAACTAAVYALTRTAAETLSLCGAVKPSVRIRMTADFHAQGTEVLVRSIFVSRLGILGIAAAQLGLAVLHARKRLLLPEEETYAAAPH